MPETNGTWYWSAGENWLQANSLEQLIQDLQVHNGKEQWSIFQAVMRKSCNNL
jgi:general secretion pathway protein L